MINTFCGYVALLGQPNSGKSTLLNACLGQKIVGVSSRPQTTRNRIAGIEVLGSRQIVFLDSPGIHPAAGKPAINRSMNKVAWSVAAEADVICYLIDVKRGWSAYDGRCLKELSEQSRSPLLIVLTKTDSVKKAVLSGRAREFEARIAELGLPASAAPGGHGGSRGLLPGFPWLVSAKRKDQLKDFKEKVACLLPEGPWLYEPDDLTDKPESFVVGELIREHLFRRFSDEIPYGCGVRVGEVCPDKQKVTVRADIIVARKNHKPMIIGCKGQSIRALGIVARNGLERYFGRKVRLELTVRVEAGWVNDPDLISELQQIDEPA